MNPPSEMPNMLTYDAVSKAWEPENIGLRPKIPSWNECDTIIFMSFNSVSLIGGVSFEWLGLENWVRIFTDSVVLGSWLRSGIYFIATVGLEMVLGIGIALLLNEIIWGTFAVLSLILMPMFVAPVIVGLLGRFLTDSTYGLYAWVLNETGIYTQDILGTPGSAETASAASGR
jgi:multiple sugar transport system permease protein